MPLTDKSDAELAALVAERVMGWRKLPENEPAERGETVYWTSIQGPVRVLHQDKTVGESWDPPNDLNDIWAACRKAKERGLILGFSVTDDQEEGNSAYVFAAGCCVYEVHEIDDPRASGRLTIALLRACGAEEE